MKLFVDMLWFSRLSTEIRNKEMSRRAHITKSASSHDEAALLGKKYHIAAKV